MEPVGVDVQDKDPAAEAVVSWDVSLAASETKVWKHINHWDYSSSTVLS